LKSYVKQMNMQKPTRKVSCMIEWMTCANNHATANGM
jgi:hypothetical protein